MLPEAHRLASREVRARRARECPALPPHRARGRRPRSGDPDRFGCPRRWTKAAQRSVKTRWHEPARRHGVEHSNGWIATNAAIVPCSGKGARADVVGDCKRQELPRVHKHISTSADAPRPAKMGFNPAVGLLARGVSGARLPELAFSGLVSTHTAYSCGGSLGLAKRTSRTEFPVMPLRAPSALLC